MAGAANSAGQLPEGQRPVRAQRLPADGITDPVFDHNEVTGNNTGDWETRSPGAAAPAASSSGRSTAPRTNNYVHDNLSAGLWADPNNVDFRFEGNYIEGNDGEGLFYETSYNAVVPQQPSRQRLGGRSSPTTTTASRPRSVPLRVRRRLACRGPVPTVRDQRQPFDTTGRGVSRGRTPTASATRRPTPAPASAPAGEPTPPDCARPRSQAAAVRRLPLEDPARSTSTTTSSLGHGRAQLRRHPAVRLSGDLLELRHLSGVVALHGRRRRGRRSRSTRTTSSATTPTSVNGTSW